MQGLPNIHAVQEYWLDAWQRSVLFLDTLRERGNIYQEQSAKEVPHVLTFQAELVRDGRTLERPVNYALVRIMPPAGTQLDPTKAPIIVVDPRAGHGPGIGGMKHDSEIGVAMAAGHACYFVGFLPKPMLGQTIEDVCRAEAIFVEDVAARHSDAEGKPIIIANCQAGWQIMMMAAPIPTGPVRSCWPDRRCRTGPGCTARTRCATWAACWAAPGSLRCPATWAMASSTAPIWSPTSNRLNPANTYWSKAYNVYSKVDTERERFLDFETWWGSPVLLNAGEMQWIADNLFVGNRLVDRPDPHL